MIFLKKMLGKQRKRLNGFTLLELLVVIAIIGVLASVVLASLNAARAKARDSRILADFENVSLALNFYYDKYGFYPHHDNANCCYGDHETKFERMAQDLINEGFLAAVPTSPSDTAYKYYDYGRGSVPGGIIVAELETIGPTTTPPFGSCRPFTNNWCSSTNASRQYCLCHPY